ncbi:MAG TPA: RluA family pseudouridine synthase [Candidatus Binataceae bacterium]|nr:RluA family pseudouridine synthase [Candidatus Binataceae bacterium]
MITKDRQFQIASSCELLPYLTGPPLGLSRKQAKDLLRFRAVTVQGKATVRHDTELQPGDVVTIAARKQLGDGVLERHGLAIVHLDDAVVVVDKPPGLLAMGSEREKERTAYRILNTHLKTLRKTPAQQVFIVHRLDRETSGLMMFARDESAQAALQRNWKGVVKKYLAVVEGVPAEMRGTLKDRLLEGKSLMVRRVEEGGELAITHYRVLGAKGDRSLLELTLETGRRNQIRVQLAALGHPVAGDRKYGAKTDPARRLALHACELRFRHPVSGAPMEFHSALPSRLAALVEGRAPRRSGET